MKKLTYFLVLLLICISLMVTPIFALSPIPIILLESFSEYSDYVETAELLDCFVPFEQLSFLGEFYSFEYPEDENKLSYSYRYTLSGYSDKTGNYRFWVFLYLEEKFLIEMDLHDPSSESSKILGESYWYSDNLVYLYDGRRPGGKVNKIAIKVDNTWILIDLRTDIFDFEPKLFGKNSPKGDDDLYRSLMRKFLNKKTTEDAYEEFVCRVKGEPLPQKSESDTSGCKSVISGGVMTAVICGGAALVLLPKKKKR